MNERDAKPLPEIPDFTLCRAVGSGGFGTVYLARNKTTGHLRAVKVIPLERTGRIDAAGREILSLTRLETHVGRNHPNLATIDHIGKTESNLFYVMEPADDITGKPAASDVSYRPATLDSRLKGGPLPSEQCLSCTRELLSGLAALHEAGMIHRDVKPSNCLFVNGILKLADFGLLTSAGPDVSRMGTETYMPPDGRMDTRADVYAAGLVIYEMISGLPADRFPHLGARAREASSDATLRTLMHLVLRACEPDPHDRFADATAMANTLKELSKQRLSTTAARSTFRRRILLGTAACGTAALFIWWLTSPSYVPVNFITRPHFEALVELDGNVLKDADGRPYRTPCTVENVPARTYHVLFKRDGLDDLDAGRIDFTTIRQVTARWPDTQHL